MYFEELSDRLVIRESGTTMYLLPWGKDAFRFQMTKEASMNSEDFALRHKPEGGQLEVTFESVDMTEPFYHTPEEREENASLGTRVTVKNGKITAEIDPEGVISYYNGSKLLTKEYWRNRNRIDRFATPLRIDARELKPIMGTDNYELTMRFEAYEEEKFYGLGQYQEDDFNKKGYTLELAHRNSQCSIPFMISNRGYGFFWNNPAIGRVSLAKNIVEWYARSTKKMDYLIIAGDTPADIEELYTASTGRTPMIPEYGIGFWQCKLRYRTQEEVLNVAREYKRRGIPLDVIVIDFFHWTRQGEFKFDPHEWPDPDAMIKELREMNIEPVVSVWPTIDEHSENYPEMNEKGYLIKSDRGNCINMTWMGNTTFYDATNPDARKFVWNICKKNYFDKGIKCFWLDEAEPEYGPYDFDLYRYYKGPALSCSNLYPLMYAKGFHDGLKNEGVENVLNLVRAAWAGSQKYGVLTWSGDIHSSFKAMKQQVQAGLSMAIAGIPWWTSDIGGFLGGDNCDPDFKELMARWFAYGAFCPIFRLHGERSPYKKREQEFRDNIRLFSSGQDNEIWTWGEEIYEIMKNFILIREKLRPYIRDIMMEAHEKGSPVMRPLWYEFPKDEGAWEETCSYMFGPSLLIAPVCEKGVEEITVYLPKGANWIESRTGNTFTGGKWVLAKADLATIPVFIREGSDITVY